ncbi:MAG: nucleoside-diphosphate sugar epimerase/dehydratase [Candidatus Rifleibacteriota bacterium]
MKFGEFGPLPWRFLTVGFPVMLPVCLAVIWLKGLYRRSPRFASIDDLIAVFVAISSCSFLKIVISKLLVNVAEIPAIFILDWMLSMLLLGAVRFLPRLVLSLAEVSRVRRWLFNKSGQPLKRVLIIGAGQAGECIAREIRRNINLPYLVAGFLDDDPGKVGQKIHGYPVLGACSNVAELAEANLVDEVIIAIPSARGAQLRRIFELCQHARLRFKTLPALDDIDRNQLFGLQLREIGIEDLLRRPPTEINHEEINACIFDKSVMITGAGGSIGAEICTQLLRYQPRSLLLLGRGENSLYDCSELLRQRPDCQKTELMPIIADIRDRERIEQIFSHHQPEIVFHCAGHKQVALMESCPEEAIKNNVIGTLNLAEAAHKNHCERFVLISTDQAVNPTSVIGASKNLAEQILLSFKNRSPTRFTAVRFGNVLGSRGSVLPMFQQQIASGGPIEITHEQMVRYFLTLSEAGKLVLQSMAYGKGGEIFVFDMGEPVRIVDLAENLIRLAGKKPGEDIAIEFTGIRPGEKLFEELLISHDGVLATRNPKIFIYPSQVPNPEKLKELLEDLQKAAEEKDQPQIIKLLKKAVPGFVPDRDSIYRENRVQTGKKIPRLRLI